MARRYDILQGDSTSKSGTVIGGSPTDRVGSLEQAYEGDAVWCPACETEGRIVCVGPRIATTGPDGRQAALSDDWCVCECEPSPLLIASQATSYVDV